VRGIGGERSGGARVGWRVRVRVRGRKVLED
jgi:hypothetical protein